MDIVIPEDRIGDFFFLDDEEEKAQYGASADYAQAAQLTQQLMKNAQKNQSQKQQNDNKYKQLMDFKVRAVDFLSIYVKQRGYQKDPAVQLKLIRGLLKALSTASTDKHTILFERIKSVLALMAKQGSQAKENEGEATENGATEGAESSDEAGLLLSEMSRLLLKPNADPANSKAYADCFTLLTKHYYD